MRANEQTHPDAEGDLHRERSRGSRRALYLLAGFLLFSLGGSVVVAQVERTMMKAYAMPSSSMEPTIHCARPAAGCERDTKDRFFVLRLHPFWAPRRGDIVAFKTTEAVVRECFAGGTYVKRIVGLPGETLQLRLVRGREFVYIGGRRLEEPYVEHRGSVGGPGTWTVPEDEYFVLGDNRTQSCDSRHFGAVPRSNFVGPVVAFYWPPDRIGLR